MPDHTEEDRLFIRLLRSQMGEDWAVAKPYIVSRLPAGTDPTLLAKYVDDRKEPGIHLNAWGVEPLFYAHRTSRRLLEFYQIRGLK